MKKFFTTLSFIFLLSITTSAQTASIELRDGSGVLLSTHASITEAYTAIPTLLTQSYLIEILAPYNASSETLPIIFNNRAGSSPERTITIRPAAGNTGESIVASLSGNSTIVFDNCEYVILDGRPGGTGTEPDLTIENTFTTGTATYTIHFRNGASNNTMRYCIPKNYTMTTAGPRNIYFGLSPSNVNGNSYNLIDNCNVIGGRSGFGTSGTAGSPNTGNIIRNCLIEGFGYAAIWLVGNTSSTVIEGNIMRQTVGYNTTIVYGILSAASGAIGNTIIRNNKIYNIQMTATGSATVKGMILSVNAGATLDLYNNFVSLPLDNLNVTSLYGIHIQGTTSFTSNVYYNTVFIAGNHSGGADGTVTSAAFVKTSSDTTAVFNMKNNLFVNLRTGGNVNAFHTGSFVNPAGILDVDYNLSYAIGGANSFHGGWNGFLYNDLAAYKTAAAPHESNSIFKNVHFVSAENLHLSDSSAGDSDLGGIPITGITTDIDGQTRSLTQPYKGADEADVPVPVELVNLQASVNGNSITLSWSTATEINNYGFEVERNRNNNAWEKAGFIKGAGNSLEIKSYSFTDQQLTSAVYNYRLKQIDHDGSYKYYNLSEAVNI
jgi:hypothetical protein